VDIFTKDFVYLPACQKEHWILVIIESLREPVTENGTAPPYVLNPLTNYLGEPTEIRTYAQSFPAPFSNEKANSPNTSFDSTTNSPAQTHFFEHVMTYILMILIHPLYHRPSSCPITQSTILPVEPPLVQNPERQLQFTAQSSSTTTAPPSSSSTTPPRGTLTISVDLFDSIAELRKGGEYGES